MNSQSQEATKNLFNILPRPLIDKQLWQANLEYGFRVYPQRHENYLKYQSCKRQKTLDYLPVRLDIENVSRCNYRCSICQVSGWPRFKRAEDMSFEDYKRLIDTQYGLIEIKLQGMGEPLLGKDYFKMIKYARKRYIWVRSTTNGSLLHINDNYKHVVDSDICELQVSIDGTFQKTYEKIRRGGDFKRVVKNCVLLNKYCQYNNFKRTRMWVVVQKNNFSELERFPIIASEIGFERLSLTVDLNNWGQGSWYMHNNQLDIHRDFDFHLAQRLISIGKKYNVEVTFWFIERKFDISMPEKLCPWPFERLYITSDMRMVPCCMVANPQVCDFGDARELSTLWNGDGMVVFRNSHLCGDIPKFCRYCYN